MNEKVAVVTGGSSGIGARSARLLAAEGAGVVLCSDQNVEAGKSVVGEIEDRGGIAMYRRVDVKQPRQVRELIETAVEQFGRLDVIFNNAGINGEFAPITDYAEDMFDEVLAVDLKGVWLGMKYAIPAILESGGGAVVNTASILGMRGYPDRSAYCAAKAGVVNLTRAVALEYADRGVRVNAVAPGAVRTPLIEQQIREDPELEEQYRSLVPRGEMLTPKEVAEVVVFLASDAARGITGSVLPVDGGYLAGS